MKPIIKVENLSKQYRIGARQAPYATLRESISNAARAPFNWLRRNGDASDSTIWALKDVSFEVMPGEVVGVIGRNGAGKSTLLKLLSRITEPTTGKIDLYGRVGSLLEVGTGFHAELSGRENIYLNGAILGMRRDEIERKFDEIVAFAEIEKFIDTPVKHYSSGMYTRLAFAVAAHLEPEILVVDEVLAVGDTAFQKKCLGKMGEVARQGRTILFVSHNMMAISHLCEKSVLLEAGRIEFTGTSRDCIHLYNEKGVFRQSGQNYYPPHVIYEAIDSEKSRDFAITKIETLNERREPKALVSTWDSFIIRIWYSCKKKVRHGSVEINIKTPDGARLLLLSTEPDGNMPMSLEIGESYADCAVEQFPLSAGNYIVGAGLAASNIEYLYYQSELGCISVEAKDVYESGLAPIASRSLFAVKHAWYLPSHN